MTVSASERVRLWRLANPGRRAAQERERYASDPEYRAKRQAENKARYQGDLEKERERSRVKQAKWRKNNPEKDAVHSGPTARRRRHLAKRYNSTVEQLNDLLDKQNGVCALCETSDPGKRWWHIDHCHKTGKVRALLCINCNTGIGKLKDDAELIEKALNYIKYYDDLFSKEG